MAVSYTRLHSIKKITVYKASQNNDALTAPGGSGPPAPPK